MPNKLISLLLAVCMLMCLAACGEKGTNNDVKNDVSEPKTDISQTVDDAQQNETTDGQISSITENIPDDNNVQSQVPSENKPVTQPQINSTQTQSGGTSNQTTHKHSYSSATCTSPKTCSCGETAGTALGHQFSTATCTSPQICSRCGNQGGKALGHQFSAATCTSPKVCTRCSITQGGALGHNYVNNKCSRCQKVDPESLPVKLKDIPTISVDPAGWYSYSDNLVKDSYGNTYSGYHSLSANGLGTLTVDYNLSGKYRNFSCDLVAPEYLEVDGKLDIQFYVDGNLVYYKSDYTKTTGRIHIDFSVAGGQRLAVKVTKTEGGLKGHGRSLLLVNAQLKK